LPRRRYRFLPGRENDTVDCFAFYRDKSGRPSCDALTDIYCMKSPEPCVFFATPQGAAKARRRAEILRLMQTAKKR
jgi:hypothetical protein